MHDPFKIQTCKHVKKILWTRFCPVVVHRCLSTDQFATWRLVTDAVYFPWCSYAVPSSKQRCGCLLSSVFAGGFLHLLNAATIRTSAVRVSTDGCFQSAWAIRFGCSILAAVYAALKSHCDYWCLKLCNLYEVFSSLFCYCGKRGIDGFCCTQINACWTTGCSLCCYLCLSIISYVVLIALWHMECAPVDCTRLVLFLNGFSEKSHVACHLSETNSHPLLRSTPDLVPPTMVLGRYQSLISWL